VTPYVSDSYHSVASYFAQRGYGFLLVDCRGRGNSEGSFEPFINDANDAYDVVEWTAGQDFSNGRDYSGGGVANETKADARTAHVVLHHDSEYQSELTVPLGEAVSK
jgi:alpha/beta superfamily hydrolase